MKKLILILITIASCANGMCPNETSCITSIVDHEMPTLLKYFLALGANPNGSDPDGITPLHRAATMNDPHYTDLLLKYGANPTARNKAGWMPIHYASTHNKPAIIALLVQNGADPNTITNPITRSTPLHLAASRLNTAAAQALLEAGANPLATNMHEQTALHEICTTIHESNDEHVALANLLIAYADKKGCFHDDYVFAVDKNGNKAANYLNEDQQELARALRSKVEIDKEQFHAMLKRRKMNTATYLLNCQLGRIRPR